MAHRHVAAKCPPCLLTPCCRAWSDCAPFPESELVIEDEPECEPEDEEGERETSDKERQQGATPEASRDGGAYDDEEDDMEEGDLAEFEEQDEQAHFSAFTARVCPFTALSPASPLLSPG